MAVQTYRLFCVVRSLDSSSGTQSLVQASFLSLKGKNGTQSMPGTESQGKAGGSICGACAVASDSSAPGHLQTQSVNHLMESTYANGEGRVAILNLHDPRKTRTLSTC